MTSQDFADFASHGRALDNCNIASGPMVQSSYHADLQFAGVDVTRDRSS